MTDLTPIGLAGACLFVAAMIYVIWHDFAARRISNIAILVLLTAFAPLALAEGLSAREIALSLAAGFAVFAIGFACFAANLLGGGDVKLAAVTALWLGPALTPVYLVLGVAFGGLLAALVLMVRAIDRGAALKRHGWIGRLVHEDALPYGPGLAVAALMLFPTSALAGAGA